jgi:hypothetical protein
MGALHSEGRHSALLVDMCLAQHLSLTAQTGHSATIPNAAARPVRAAIRAWRSIFVG